MTSPNSEEFLLYVSSYEPTSQVVEHPTLGRFNVVRNEQGHKILRKKIEGSQLAKIDIGIFEQYKSLGYDRIVKFLGITENTDGDCEGYSAYYELFGENLKEEIERRGQEGNPYTELEVLKILQNISSSLSYMMASKVYHGEIKSMNIVKVGQDYKVLNPILFGKFLHLSKDAPPSLPKFHTKIVTPEVRNALYREIIDPVHEIHKDDVYGLGLIALDLMTLKVDPSTPVEKRLEKSNFLFSNVLVRFVKKMVEKVFSLRLDPVACNSYIERIQLQHGLVSAQRFSRRTRNYSVMDRDGERESITSDVPEENIPALQKQPSRENRYNRRTESVAPAVDIRMNETMRQSIRPVESTSYENPMYVKKMDEFERRTISVRQSTASTAFSGGPRESRWETVRESRWSVWDTPRGSVVTDYLNTDRSNGKESVLSSVNIPLISESMINTGNREYKFEETKVQQGERSPVRSSQLDTPADHLFTTPPRFSDSSLQSSPEDIYKNCKYVQSEVATPQAQDAWKYDITSDRSHYSHAGTTVPTYGLDVPLVSSETVQSTNYFNTNKDKVEISTRTSYMPVTNDILYPPKQELTITTEEDKIKEIALKPSPRFFENDKETFKNDFPVSTDLSQGSQPRITTEATLNLDGPASHRRLHTNSFMVSMNDILPTEMQKSTEEDTNADLEYIEDEQSIDQTFSDPVTMAECYELSQPKQIEYDSRYSLPSGHSTTANLTTDFSITRTEIQPERKTLAPHSYSNFEEQKYFSSYQPRQSYEAPSFQSKMTKTTTETLPDGSIYEGEVLGYMKQGKGKLTYPDGKYYDGDWKVGQINGQGILYARDGSVIYDGQWQDAKFFGRGTLTNLFPIARSSEGMKVYSKEEGSWTKYTGSFRNNQWEGFGELSFANGDKYIGEFKKDALNGKGKYLSADGLVWEGQWLNNSFIQD